MPQNDAQRGNEQIPFKDEAITLHGPLTEAERKEVERERRYEEQRRNDDAYKNRQLGIADGQLRTNNRLAIYTFLLVILGLIGNGISYLNSRAAQKSADAAKSAAESASESLRESKASSRISEQLSNRALSATIEQNRLDQRAWVGVTSGRIVNLLAGKRALIDIVFSNTGKTIAFVDDPTVMLSIHRVGNIRRMDDHDLRAEHLPHGVSELALFPGAQMHSSGRSESPLTPEEIALISNGTLGLRVSGYIRYRDIFQRQHLTTYCFFYDPSMEVNPLRACENHNTAN